MRETTYCDLLESDDYYTSNTYIFQSIFATPDPRQYAYEHSVNPRAKDSFKRTPTGRRWSNVWQQIDSNQNRAPGKRRNRYHVLCETKRITVPAQVEHVPITETVVNPLGGDLRFTRTQRRETPPVYGNVELLYFDIDDMSEASAFLNLPNAIWARSPGGRCHVFVLILPGDYHRVRQRVAQWMYRNQVKAENNLIPRGGKTLDTILVPGQDRWTLPCEPGKPDNPIVSNYDETMSLFVNHQRLDVDVAFPISREISIPAIPDTESIQATSPEGSLPIPIYKVKRNRPRFGGLCNIPGITGALRITRGKGAADERAITEFR